MPTRRFACDAFSDALYASTLHRKLVRSAAIGWRYYVWDLPRYLMHRRAVGLSGLDLQAAINPVYEFFDRKGEAFLWPEGGAEALDTLCAVGVELTLPPSRVSALVHEWNKTGAVEGDVIECGSFRGATALLIALLGKLHGRRQKVLMFDTFRGSPPGTRRDSLRTKSEYALPTDYLCVLHRQAVALGIEDRVEVHQGEFRHAFGRIAHLPRRFCFAHIDANLYQSTLDACSFVIPRVAAGGAVVFDDYHGPCDLGARLAVDEFCASRGLRPRRLAGSSAYLHFEAC